MYGAIPPYITEILCWTPCIVLAIFKLYDVSEAGPDSVIRYEKFWEELIHTLILLYVEYLIRYQSHK
jgi:hypothetical protein